LPDRPNQHIAAALTTMMDETEMRKRLAFLCVIALFSNASAFAQSTDAMVSTVERTFWDHNGSVMYLVADGPSREFYYKKPRPGMLEAGAHPDSLLFKGQINDGHFSGTAYLFTAHCGQVPFAVKGPIPDNGEKIVLTGQVPRLGRNCQAYGEYTSTLEFKLLKTTEVAQPEQTPTTAQTQGIEESKPEPLSSDAGEPKLPITQTPQSIQPPKVEQPKPEVPSSVAGKPKLPIPPPAEAPLTAQTPGIETPKPKLHESEPKQPSLTTSAATAAPSFMDKNILAPLIIGLNVAFPFLSILFLILMLRKPGESNVTIEL
jgi:hypothetical protein